MDTRAAFAGLFDEIRKIIFNTEFQAYQELIQLNKTLLAKLPAYIGLEDQLEMAIESSQRALGLPVVKASKKFVVILNTNV